MFQVFTGDGWSDLARSLFVNSEVIDLDVSLFFVSYIFIAGIVLFNVVVAVLLDEFLKYIQIEKERELKNREAALSKSQITGCLDELTKTLALFRDEEDLQYKIDALYTQLDTDDSGGLNFEEFCRGLRYLSLTNKCRGIHLTRDDFDSLTEHGALLGARGEFNRSQFSKVMKGELQQYAQRCLTKALLLSDNQEFHAAMVISKLNQSSNKEVLEEIKRDQLSNKQVLDEIKRDQQQVCRATLCLKFTTSV
jgi:hypothetical protein